MSSGNGFRVQYQALEIMSRPVESSSHNLRATMAGLRSQMTRHPSMFLTLSVRLPVSHSEKVKAIHINIETTIAALPRWPSIPSLCP
jgi:hypothetical protein